MMPCVILDQREGSLAHDFCAVFGLSSEQLLSGGDDIRRLG